MRESSVSAIGRVRPVHPYAWLWEPLESDPTFVLRSMFGSKAAYLDGKIMLGFMARGEDPWRGVLVCTDHIHQAALQAEFPDLVQHSVLPKWLYLPESADAFEKTGERLVALVRRRDPRIGVVPKPRKKGKAGPGSKKSKASGQKDKQPPAQKKRKARP